MVAEPEAVRAQQPLAEAVLGSRQLGLKVLSGRAPPRPASARLAAAFEAASVRLRALASAGRLGLGARLAASQPISHLRAL
eukprot:15438256-Alexandrium_andersonii.AAC.1